jgi:hypothetical protein
MALPQAQHVGGRLGEHLTLTVEDVWVKGMPHDTVIIVRWSATGQPPDWSAYQNRSGHIVRIKVGQVIEIDIHEVSQAVAEGLRKQSAIGIAEAATPPITS